MQARGLSVELLNPHHDRAGFHCGVADLDRYFRERAGQDSRRHVAAVFVLLGAEPARVAGYYTLSATSVPRTHLPDSASRSLPRYQSVPAILLGRLAVDERHQGQGLGRFLLMDALQRSLTSSGQVAAFAVIVDAIDIGARAFYEQFGFVPLLDADLRLFLPMDTIATLVAHTP